MPYRRRVSLALCAAHLLVGAPAQAQILDFFNGRVIASGRVLGLGGAFIGIAQGVDGHLINPVSFTKRVWHTSDQRLDWDFGSSELRQLTKRSQHDDQGDLAPT